MEFIVSFGILFLIIVFISFIIKLLRQPIIIGYVISGVVFSAFLLKNTIDGEQIVIMSELGITFLLFLMGLEFDLKSLKYLGKDILAATFLQSLAFFFVAFGISWLFGFSPMECVYLGVLFMFGSTLLVAKWLEDKKESTSLHGKLVLGTLIMQDVIAVLALTILSVVKEPTLIKIVVAPFGAIVLVLLAFVLSKYVLNPLLKFASRYPELLFIFGLGICFLFVEISPLLGFSTTLGAFIAGITLANTIYRAEVSSKLKPLINFFNMLFFVGLGFQMDLSLNIMTLFYVILMLVVCFALKPIITYMTLRGRGYDMKTSFMSGIYLTQLSEFGIIILAAGAAAGTISTAISSIAVIMVILSMIISSYMIKYDQQVYAYFEPFIKRLDHRLTSKKIKDEPEDIDAHILFIGYNELSKDLYSKLESMGKSIVVIENDPENIELLRKINLRYVYGSPGDPEFYTHFHFHSVELIISSITDVELNKALIKEFKKQTPNVVFIATAKTLKASIELYDRNADYVIFQAQLQEQQVSTLIEDYTKGIDSIISKKVTDLMRLKEKDAERKKALEEQEGIKDIEGFMNSLGNGRNIKPAHH